MGIKTGNNIILDGLAMSYDTGNKRSLKGEPTTNLRDVGIIGMSGISYSYLGFDGEWKKYAISGSWTTSTYPYSMRIDSQSFSLGQRYSTSLYIKTNCRDKFNYLGGLNYVNVAMVSSGTNVGTVISNENGEQIVFCSRYNFEYAQATTQPGYFPSRPNFNTTFDPTTDFMWLRDAQIEAKSNYTPFAGWGPTTRSNTGALLDQLGSNTITASSLTWSNFGTQFTFNGSSDYLSFGNNATLYQAYNTTFTQEYVIKLLSNQASNKTIFRVDDWSRIDLQMSNNGLNFTIGYSSPSDTLTHTASFTTNQWYHLTFVWSKQNRQEIYVNGELVAERTPTVSNYSGITGTAGGANIGRGHSSPFNNNIHADIPIFRHYTRDLSASEIKTNFNSIKGRYGL